MKLTTMDYGLGAVFLVALAALVLPSGSPDAPGMGTKSPRAERVVYIGESSREWGTVCRIGGGYVSVHHVTENGVPAIGPKVAVTKYAEASDWSFLGVDPTTLDPADFPEMTKGEAVEIHGFPARDRDGEVIPGKVYTSDTTPPFWWVELHDADAGIEAEGVVGGLSGSCVLNSDGDVLAVVHANGFSRIEGTTNTWAMVVPVRAAIREARGEAEYASFARLPSDVPVPVIERGRWGMVEDRP